MTYDMFQNMVEGIQEDCLSMLFKVRLASPPEQAELTVQPKDRLADAQLSADSEVEREPRRVSKKKWAEMTPPARAAAEKI